MHFTKSEHFKQASDFQQGLQISKLSPRSLREPDAATYLGFSASYLRNQRVADMRLLSKGGAIQGPRWTNIGSAVRYLIEDLDEWLDSNREATCQRNEFSVQGGSHDH